MKYPMPNIVSKDSIHNMHIPIRMTHHFIAENEYGSDMSRHVNSIVKTITSTLLSRQNKRNLCYGPIQVTVVLRNFYCNF